RGEGVGISPIASSGQSTAAPAGSPSVRPTCWPSRMLATALKGTWGISPAASIPGPRKPPRHLARSLGRLLEGAEGPPPAEPEGVPQHRRGAPLRVARPAAEQHHPRGGRGAPLPHSR